MIPFLIVAAVVFTAIGLVTPKRPARSPRLPILSAEPEAMEQIDALRLYGTPETADQLRAQGIDLAALGYRDGDA